MTHHARAALVGGRWWLAPVTLLAGILLALVANPLPAAAHAQLESTTPEDGAVLEHAPGEAEFEFNESVTPIDGHIRLDSAGQDPIELPARTSDTRVVVDFPAGLDDGSYTLSYRVISADGHPVSGAIAFRVGDSQPAAPPPGESANNAPSPTVVSALTAVMYLGLLVSIGSVFFSCFIQAVPRCWDRRFRRALTMAWIVAGAASLLLIPISAMRAAGVGWSAMLAPTTWTAGVTGATILRAGAITIAGAATIALRGGSARIATSTSAVATLAGAALVGHSYSAQPAWLVIPMDLLHLATAAFWVGGVLGLTVMLMRPQRDHGSEGRGLDVVAATRVTVRFSRWAAYTVLALAASGAGMAIVIIPDLTTIPHTGYGRALLLKLVIVGAVIALAHWNRAHLLPRIHSHPTGRARWEQLRRILSYEAGLLIAVIAITGTIANLDPQHDHAAEQRETAGVAEPGDRHVQAESQGLSAEGTLAPATTGINTFRFQLDYGAGDLATAEISVEARLPEQRLGPVTAPVTKDADTGEYEAQLTLPESGQWELQVSARVSTYERPIVIIPVDVS